MEIISFSVGMIFVIGILIKAYFYPTVVPEPIPNHSDVSQPIPFKPNRKNESGGRRKKVMDEMRSEILKQWAEMDKINLLIEGLNEKIKQCLPSEDDYPINKRFEKIQRNFNIIETNMKCHDNVLRELRKDLEYLKGMIILPDISDDESFSEENTMLGNSQHDN
jgi:hypothetical protein